MVVHTLWWVDQAAHIFLPRPHRALRCSRTAIRPGAGIALALLVAFSVLGDSSRLGLLTGFSIAAPVGPVGLLCIRRSLADGPTAGFVAGLGAATCHALYATLAALGLAAVTGALQESRAILNVAGGLVLGALAVRLLLAQPRTTSGAPGGVGLVKAYFSTLAVALANPLTLLAFAGVATSHTATLGADSTWPGVPVGIFAGSAMWWLALSCVVGQFGTRIGAEHLVWTNRASGLLLAAFAVMLVLRMR
jgi:threonine/homoserine/homoserine lactone efflux protein